MLILFKWCGSLSASFSKIEPYQCGLFQGDFNIPLCKAVCERELYAL
jgi:hypothetical protein